MNKIRFDYNDINLIPKYSKVNSRSECDTSVKFGKFTFNNPVIPANMESVINEELAKKLASTGYFYILHRFNVDVKRFLIDMKNEQLITSISIGVNDDSYQLIEELISENLIPDFITIDIAHGHCLKMKKMLSFLKSKINDVFIIAGNISTVEGTSDLCEWGADAVKVGIAPGSACTTYPTTGFGSRNMQASVVYQCAEVSTKPVIADGGITCPADITKSIVLGATMVMVGGMLSSFNDSPGKIIEKDGQLFKEFYGSASARQKTIVRRVEGVVKLNPLKNSSMIDYLDYLSECLQSSISYGGGTKLEDLYNVKWM